jgi:hypothetical protein
MLVHEMNHAFFGGRVWGKYSNNGKVEYGPDWLRVMGLCQVQFRKGGVLDLVEGGKYHFVFPGGIKKGGVGGGGGGEGRG